MFNVCIKWPSRANTQKRCPYHYRGLECKSRKSRTPGATGKFGLGVQNEAGQRLIVLPREHTGHNTHSLPTTQGKTLHMDITRWSTPKSDWNVYLWSFLSVERNSFNISCETSGVLNSQPLLICNTCYSSFKSEW